LEANVSQKTGGVDPGSLLGIRGQREMEDRTGVPAGFGPDASAVRLDNSAANRQADAGSRNLSTV
jgi:hypothetical protein